MLEAEIWGIAETGDGFMIFVKPLPADVSVPIFVGRLEAQAILAGFGGAGVSRPLTIDILQSLIQSQSMKLTRIEISDLKNDTFFGKIVLEEKSGKELILDARPSDALALAVRCSGPIFVDETVVEKTGISTDDLVQEAEEPSEKSGLQKELDEAIAVENYERAAEIRDLLQSLEQ